MINDIERTQEILDALAEELPEIFYRELNGGILLLEDVKMSPEVEGLYIMGEYVKSHSLGRMIKIYHGSIKACYGEIPESLYAEKLREILRHEFCHHIENLAGDKSLEIEDQVRLNRYKAMRRERKD